MGCVIIGVQNSYLFEFSLGDKRDFIQESDLILFRIIEEAGNVLPSFEIVFTTQDESVFSYLNEGSIFKVSFGRTSDDLLDSNLSVLNKSYAKQGDTKRVIRATGLFSATGYVNSTSKRITENMSAVEVINEVVSDYFIPEFNIEMSDDTQVWIQPNTSDKQFVNDLWFHSHIKNSFIMCGITIDGRFILKDLKTDLENPYDWRFISTPVKSNDLPYDGDFGVEDTSGFINSWIGYGRERMIYNMEYGENELTSEVMTPILALTKTLSRSAEIQERFSISGVRNENCHENYWASYLNNVMKLAVMSSVKVRLGFHNRFAPIKILDKVMFKDEDVGSNKNQSSEYHSGLYYITKVVRTIQNRNILTICEMCRESLGNLKGDLR